MSRAANRVAEVALFIYVTPDLKKTIADAADSRGVTLKDLVTAAILNYIETTPHASIEDRLKRIEEKLGL